MSDYPRINQSPFFKTFPRPRRSALFPQNPQNPTHRPAAPHAEPPQGYVMPRMPHLQNNPPISNALVAPQPPARQRNMLGMSLQPEPTTPPPPSISPAEHFHNVNAALPDGVRYEPLDDDIKAAMLAINTDKPPSDAPQNIEQAEQVERVEKIAPPVIPPTPSPTEQLRKVNKGLPDGVRYEPYEKYDEETKAALLALSTGKLGQQPQSTPQPPPAAPPITHTPPKPEPPPPLPPSSHPHETEKLLECLIQDERNAAIYYQYLAEIAPKGVFQTTLTEFVDDCDKRLSQYQKIFQNLHGRTWEPQSPPINTNVGFDRGVEIAVIEENKILRTMAELQDRIEDDHSTHTLQKLLNKRIIQLNWLQWALFRVKTEGMRHQ